MQFLLIQNIRKQCVDMLYTVYCMLYATYTVCYVCWEGYSNGAEASREFVSSEEAEAEPGDVLLSAELINALASLKSKKQTSRNGRTSAAISQATMH